MFGRKNRSQHYEDHEKIAIPQEYQKVQQKLPREYGIPENAEVYVMNNGQASVLLVSFPVSEQASMPFGRPQNVIDQQHSMMGEGDGLIEVKGGNTEDGRPYIYEIIKHHYAPEAGTVTGNEYTLNINVRMEHSIQFINGSFAEEGTIGLRDTVGMAIYQKTTGLSMDEVMKTWSRDPYDPDYRKGFLMNQSEVPELDEQFPDHPLSKARAFVKYIVNNN